MGLVSFKLRTFYEVVSVCPWVNKTNLKAQTLICLVF